jgi:hypothetical protein
MQQKTAVYSGYINTPTFQTDTSLTSPDIFAITEFPERLTSGKNVIKFRGRENTLQPNSLIQVEVLDYNGDPIYSEILANYIDEDKARVIVIWVYEDTSPGDATVTLLSTLRNVPLEWKNKPNVKWTRSIAVNPTAPNVSEIIFETEPTIQIAEQVGVQLNRTYTNGQFPTYSTGTITYTDRNFKRVAVITGGVFTSDMVGGTLTVTSPTNPQSSPAYNIINNTYTSTIKKVISNTAIELTSPYTVFSNQSIFSHTYNSFGPSAFTIDFEATPIYTPTQNSESYAYVEIQGLEPASGDVSRIKVYASGKGTVGTYELTNDIELEETLIFVPSTSSIDPYVNIGSFVDQLTIDTYWESHTYLGRTETTAPILIANNALLNNSLRVTPAINIPRKNDVYVLQVSSSIAGKFIKNSQYKVTFDARAFRSTTSNNQPPKLYAYMSGSAFNYNTTDYYNQELPVNVGKRVGELEIQSESQRIDDQTFYFKADRTGTGVLLFVIESGDWYVSDIRTTTDNDPGYTPNYTRLRTEIPTKHKSGNQLSFKIEYYNVAGQRSKLISFKNNLDWQGGNRYIDGDYSMITGSLYVASTLESGIAISGLTDTGFVRSLGYSGFETGDPGFLLWSGSALPGQNTKGGVPYSGVGLELYADANNYFRYATQPSELDIRTERFFVGDPNSAFISGSDGNIEISASGFHLTAAGDVTASSFIAIQGGNVLFDSNNAFVDGLNVGRVVYFDRAEYSVTGVNLTTTPQTASIFETFILPGESSLQCSFTIRFTRAVTGLPTTIRGEWYIQSASSTAVNTTVDNYDTWSIPEIMGSGQTLISFSSPGSGLDTRGTSRNISVAIPAAYQAKYCRIYMAVERLSNGDTADVLRIKSFVYRTARVVGSSTIPGEYFPDPPVPA